MRSPTTAFSKSTPLTVSGATKLASERFAAALSRADVSPAQELLDYDPQHSIREGVPAFVDWYREDRDWYEPLVLACKRAPTSRPTSPWTADLAGVRAEGLMGRCR